MVKRLFFVALVLTAVLAVAAPALAFNGQRADYTPSDTCKGCHQNLASIPQVYDNWAETKHAESNADGQNTRPVASQCAGCHTSNYAPSKVVPTPTATSSTGAVTWVAGNVTPDTAHQADGNSAMSELAVGCSSCHQSQTAAHAATSANPANLANPEICGQCHSRYSYTVATYSIAPIPYLKVDAAGAPVPNPSPVTLAQMQMAIGFTTMGDAAGGWVPPALSTNLNVSSPGWSPTPNPQATSAGFGKLQTYWQTKDGKTLPWIQSGHDGNAAQYAEWASPVDLHAQALVNLKKAMGPNPPAQCLECHSADYIIAPDGAKPTGEQAKYGITCQACHTPHERGTATGVWDAAFTPQLRYDNAKTLCTSCHNAELGGKIATPGSSVHHPMKEMMDGVGAIDVMQGSPSVHKGKCVQCHMPPTSYSGHGGWQAGANHTFKIIEPAVAADVSPIPVATATPQTMPYSACSTCHSRPGDEAATWLQDTLTYRQEAMHGWVDQVSVALTKAAKKLGYKSTAAANTAINKKPMKKWTTNQMRFQKAFTNQSYVVSEGSWGIHNWDYARTVVLTSLAQAKSVHGK